MENLFGLGIVIDYQDRASSQMLKTQQIFHQTWQTADQLTKAMDKNAMKYNSLAKASGTLLVGGYALNRVGKSIMGMFSGAAEKSGDLQKEMNSLKFVTQGTAEEMAMFKKVAIDTGIATQFDPKEATQAMYELRSFGLDNISMLESLEATLNLVAVAGGKIALDGGAKLMASTLNKFNMDASESGRIADILAQATKDTAFHFEQFAPFLNSLRDTPTTLKRPMEEIVALGGLLMNVGFQGAEAGQTINGFTRSMSMLTTIMEKGGIGKLGGRKLDAMKAIGLDVDTLWNSADNTLKELPLIFEEIIKGASDLNDKQYMTNMQIIFGQQAKSVVSAAKNAQEGYFDWVTDETGKQVLVQKEFVEGTKKSFRDLTDSLMNSQGSASEGAKDILATWWGIKTLWAGSVSTFQTLIGDTVLPLMGNVLSTATKFLNKIIEFVAEHPRIVKALALGVGLAGLLITVAGAAAIALGGIGLLWSGVARFALMATELATSVGMASTSVTGFGSVVKFLGTKALSTILPLMFKFIAVSGLLYYAWKSDFLGIRSSIQWFASGVKSSFEEAREITRMNMADMMVEMNRLKEEDNFFSSLTVALVTLDTLWKGLVQSWNDNTLSEDMFQKLQALGLLPLIENILVLKYNAEQLWEGFKEGFGEVSGIFSKLLENLELMGFSLDPVINLLTKLTDSANATDGEKLKAIGEVLGVITAFGIGTAVLVKVVNFFVTFGGWLAKCAVSAGSLVIALGAISTIGATLGVTLFGWLVADVKSAYEWLSNLVNKIDELWRKLGAKSNAKGLLEDLFTVPGTGVNVGKEGWFPDTTPKKGGGGASFGAPVNTVPRGMERMSTGGYVKGEGAAYLHPDEIVVNDELTQKLRGYLDKSEKLERLARSSNRSVQSSSQVTFAQGSIQIALAHGTEADAERFATTVMKKIEQKSQIDKMLKYEPLAV